MGFIQLNDDRLINLANISTIAVPISNKVIYICKSGDKIEEIFETAILATTRFSTLKDTICI